MRKVTATVTVLAAALIALAASCFVHRRSDGLACTTEGSACSGGGFCTGGYCVQSPCPSPCTDCDLSDMSCEVQCGADQPCGTVKCPPGFDCTIRCTASSPCGTIDCAGASSCDITCQGSASCRGINCGSGECDVSCSGAGACASIDCADACRCDVSCNNPVACPSMSCPRSLVTDTPCIRQGGAQSCSSDDPGCDTCLSF